MIKTPKFWDHTYGLSQALRPLSWIYTRIAAWRESRVTPVKVSIPVICVGNLVMGGAGKTPTVMAIVEILKELGHTPHILCRGYGAYIKGTINVDPKVHGYLQVGDEPLMLAEIAPTWVSADRIESAKAAIQQGASILVMDDGLQNASIHKDFSFIVIDVLQGFGNSFVFPAGPLREPIHTGLKRGQAIILIGDPHLAKQTIKGHFGAKIVHVGPIPTHPVVAFAGIGYPLKFRHTLHEHQYTIREFVTFADHYPYTIMDMRRLRRIANNYKADLITTKKDHLRLPSGFRDRVLVLPIRLKFDNPGAIKKLLHEKFPIT
ncbi:MAG: tetraacyldisaccharide 4'-kinase [Alphaproteobacteria bacterium]|nr:tetraacyldisaccharide 4'-kinase [Alphaproteobacteria bacterium]